MLAEMPIFKYRLNLDPCFYSIVYVDISNNIKFVIKTEHSLSEYYINLDLYFKEELLWVIY